MKSYRKANLILVVNQGLLVCRGGGTFQAVSPNGSVHSPEFVEDENYRSRLLDRLSAISPKSSKAILPHVAQENIHSKPWGIVSSMNAK